jgi:8-amino-7-oxononanoate synthase
VTDGACPACGRGPLADYLEIADERGGVLLVDDTQALGILGADPSNAERYGRGGGGTLVWLGVGPAAAIVVASMAKGFGAPVAVTGGRRAIVDRLVRDGDTRVHCSPPTVADLLAAEHALAVNDERGDDLRRRLGTLVTRLRDGLDRLGVLSRVDDFPIQPVGPFRLPVARRLHDGLRRRGVLTILQKPRCGHGAHVTFIVTATHGRADVDAALAALASALADAGSAVPRGA